ncbi:hypothetical protein [Actinomadura mexicana]|uniref:hypothetical protein n=1 Tax=Actinomadura mexicana TaxID=134959 RepID=UPI001177B052|nr:hypothetical protein [Actinomadura mexicana]
METTNALRCLADELDARGWRTVLRAGTLTVANPDAPRLADAITCDGCAFWWTWGQEAGPADDIVGVADRIVHVLRTAAP